MGIVVDWNGVDFPEELRTLPKGRYILTAVESTAPDLTAEEEAGLEAALASVRAGRTVSIDEARQQVHARLGR